MDDLSVIIYVSLFQSIIIKTISMNTGRTRAQIKINTGAEINTCSFKTGCRLSSAAANTAMDMQFKTLSVVWNELAGQLAAGECASV